MQDEPNDDRPWTEAAWKRFLQKSETRSARYRELFETLLDHPDRDQIIAREMGWNQEYSSDEDFSEAPNVGVFRRDEECEDLLDREQRVLNAIPAYSRGFAWGLSVHDALKENLNAAEDPEPDDPLVVAFSDSIVVAAKIAGGHGLGYEDSSICGNIICCLNALEATDRGIAALQELIDHQKLSSSIVQPLLDEGRVVRSLVARHIASLRRRVWWE